MRHQTTNGYENYILGGYKPLRCYSYVGLNNLGAMGMKTFAADIYESGNLEPQTVFCYIIDEYPGEDGEPTADVLIKMPLYVRPAAIRLDVEPYIEDFGLKLGLLKYTLAPQNTMIHP